MEATIDAYVALLAQSLKAMPPDRRDKELREVRAHLIEQTQKLVDSGQSADDAAIEALRRFGDPEVVGRELVAVWRRENRRAVARAAIFMNAQMVVAATIALFVHGPRELPLRWLLRDGHPGITALVIFWTLSIVAGFVTGFALPRGAVKAATCSAVTWYLLQDALGDHVLGGPVGTAAVLGGPAGAGMIVGGLLTWALLTAPSVVIVCGPVAIAAKAGVILRRGPQRAAIPRPTNPAVS